MLRQQYYGVVKVNSDKWHEASRLNGAEQCSSGKIAEVQELTRFKYPPCTNYLCDLDPVNLPLFLNFAFYHYCEYNGYE